MHKIKITDLYLKRIRQFNELPNNFKKALVSMYNKERQLGIDGQLHQMDLITFISIDQGVFLYDLYKKVVPARSLEIGCAYGYSTIFILAAIQANGIGYHMAMDPYEMTDWHGIGLKKVEDLEMGSFFKLIPKHNYFGFADLIRENQKFDFIFIDGDHRFECLFLDISLSDYILSENGYIILHDLWLPSVKKIVKYFKNNRADYKILSSLKAPDMVVLKKISKDTRPWDFFEPF